MRDENEVPPSEQRGGRTPGSHEAAEKGEWAAHAQEGVVPADLGGSDAPEELKDDDPELEDSALGRTTGTEAPATSRGVDPHGGDQADATTQGGPDPAAGEPNQRDAASGPRQSDVESAESD